MEIKLTANINGTSKSVIVPIQKVVDAFWPKGETPPFALTVSTVLGTDRANAEFIIHDETKESYPGIWLTTENVKSHRHCSWFCLELPNETNSMVKGHLYGGDDDMETDQPLAIIVDGVRDTNDESKRALWVDKEVTHIESLTDDYQERQKAITEKQIADLDVGDFLKDFDYAAYGSVSHPKLRTLWNLWPTLLFPAASRKLIWSQTAWRLWGFPSRRVTLTRTMNPRMMCRNSLWDFITCE